jgi:hypothetical protein
MPQIEEKPGRPHDTQNPDRLPQTAGTFQTEPDSPGPDHVDIIAAATQMRNQKWDAATCGFRAGITFASDAATSIGLFLQ